MAYVSGYEHDVFVSYAHDDNCPVPGTGEQWVSMMVECIKHRLGEHLGRDRVGVWKDEQLTGHEPFPEQLLKAARSAATLVVVQSPGYMRSKWCGQEREAFLQVIKERNNSRVFVVERSRVENRPREFEHLLGFPFWVAEPGSGYRTLGYPKLDAKEVAYYAQINKLCDQLAKHLIKLESEAVAQPSAVSEPSEVQPQLGKTVFLAETTDDLWRTRESVREYLEQFGARIVPKKWYRQDAEGFRSAAENDLQQCDVFVQLLSDAPGRMPEDVPQGYPKLQFELAREAGKPILQWRSNQLDLEKVDEAVVRELLQESTVRAEPIADFKAKVKEVLHKVDTEEEDPGDLGGFIFINREPEDKEFAEAIQRELVSLGADVVWPLECGDTTERRKFLEQSLSACDGVLLIHGRSPVGWVSSQLLQCRKALARRKDRSLRGVAICQFPPLPKDELNMSLRDLQVLDCGEGLSQQNLYPFLKNVTGAARA